MPSIDRLPNKNRTVRALDIYRDAMRSFIAGKLKEVAPQNGDIKDIVIASMPETLYQRLQNLNTNDEISNSLEEKHFPYLIEKNWDECFHPSFGYDETVLRNAKQLVKVRNQVAHPTQDPEGSLTIRRLDKISGVLTRINKWEDKRAVEAIKNEVEETHSDVISTKSKGTSSCKDEPRNTSNGREGMDIVLDDTGKIQNGDGGEVVTGLTDETHHSKKPELGVKPIVNGHEILSYTYDDGYKRTVWNIQDELWIVQSSDTSVVAYRDVGTRADLILKMDIEIGNLLYANNYPMEFAGENKGDEDYLRVLEEEFADESSRLHETLEGLVDGLFFGSVSDVVSKVEQHQKNPALRLVAVGNTEMLGSDPKTGEAFWRVGDSYWCSEEDSSGIRARVLDDETLQRSRVISTLIPK